MAPLIVKFNDRAENYSKPRTTPSKVDKLLERISVLLEKNGIRDWNQSNQFHEWSFIPC